MSGSDAPSPFLRVREVMARYRRARSTIYLWMETSDFPRPLKVGPRVVVWRLSEIETWERCDSDLQVVRSFDPTGDHDGSN